MLQVDLESCSSSGDSFHLLGYRYETFLISGGGEPVPEHCWQRAAIMKCAS